MSSIDDIPPCRRSSTMNLRTPKDIGALIRQRRRDLGLDQRTLAERVGASRQWIIDAEAGKPRIELGLILRTLEVLGVRLATAETKPKARSAAITAVPDIDAVVRAARRPRQ